MHLRILHAGATTPQTSKEASGSLHKDGGPPNKPAPKDEPTPSTKTTKPLLPPHLRIINDLEPSAMTKVKGGLEGSRWAK